MALRRIEGNLEEHLALLFKNEMNFEFFIMLMLAHSIQYSLSHSQLLILRYTPYTPLCLARYPSKVYYWKLSITLKMYCWDIFWETDLKISLSYTSLLKN